MTTTQDRSGCGTRMLNFCAEAVRACSMCASVDWAAVGDPRICELGDASKSFSPSLHQHCYVCTL